MKLGTPYWAIRINSRKLENKVARNEYRDTLKTLQFDLKHYSKGKLDHKTKDLATETFDALPKYLQDASCVEEHTPVLGIF